MSETDRHSGEGPSSLAGSQVSSLARHAVIPWRRRLAGIALGILAWLAFLLLAGRPQLAEAVAGSGPIPELRRWLSLLSGVIPFSLMEFVVVAVLLRQGEGIWRGLALFRRGAVTLPRTFLAGGLRLGQDVGVLLLLFYLFWGFQYARPGLEERLGIDASGEVWVEELRPLAESAVERANLLYREIHGSPDGGTPTPPPSISSMVPSLEEGWNRTRTEYDLPENVTRRYGAPKSFLATEVMKRFGVAGMHFPFTGEALILRDLPGAERGRDLGHEMAHQRGFASESDANVLGFLVARESSDLVTRYGAYFFLQRQLVSALQRISPPAAREVARTRDPGIVRDLQDLSAFWEPARGTAGAIGSRVNDAMLRSHRIPEGVASYQGSVWVFVALARERGGEALFGSLPD